MRIMEIITTELALDKLKSEENLQNIINSNEYTSEIKVTKIKDELEKIVVANNMIDTWIKYIGTDKSNNNNNNNNEQ